MGMTAHGAELHPLATIFDAPVHTLAAAFPPLSDAEYAALKASIAEVGLLSPVLLTDDGQLLDGVHRRRACQELGVPCGYTYPHDGQDPIALVIAANNARRHMTTDQKARVAARLATYGSGGDRDQKRKNALLTQEDAAAAMGVSRRTVQQAAKAATAPVLDQAVAAGAVAVSDAAAVVGQPEDVQREAVARVESKQSPTLRKAAAAINRERRREEAAANAKPAPNLHVCAVADLHLHVDRGTVDAIVTDPPYGSDFIDAGVFAQLAVFAMRALRPGGLCLVLAGQHDFPTKLRNLIDGGLEYRWLVAYTMPEGVEKAHAAKVTVRWKPWIALTRPGGAPEGYSTDCIPAGRPAHGERESHRWGQTPTGMEAVLSEWVKKPGSVVCDPFCGAGSIPAAADALGHTVIAADVDAASVEMTRRKLEGGS